MKKEKLLEEFLENKIIISEIYEEYKKIIDYYNKTHGYGYSFKSTKVIFDFIEGNYYQLTYDDGLNYERLEEWIKEIKEYETNDYIFELIDVDDEVILESYSAFQSYVDYCEDDFDNLAILRDAQFIGFENLFGRISKDFIKFLVEKKELYKENI